MIGCWCLRHQKPASWPLTVSAQTAAQIAQDGATDSSQFTWRLHGRGDRGFPNLQRIQTINYTSSRLKGSMLRQDYWRLALLV